VPVTAVNGACVKNWGGNIGRRKYTAILEKVIRYWFRLWEINEVTHWHSKGSRSEKLDKQN
jgi:hypothetical protein